MGFGGLRLFVNPTAAGPATFVTGPLGGGTQTAVALWGGGNTLTDSQTYIDANGYMEIDGTTSGVKFKSDSTTFAYLSLYPGSVDVFDIISYGASFTPSGLNQPSSTLIQHNLTGALSFVTTVAAGVMDWYTGGVAAGNFRMRLNSSTNGGGLVINSTTAPPISAGLVIANKHIQARATSQGSWTADAHLGATGTATGTTYNDVAGLVTLTPGGAGIASGLQATLAFNLSYTTSPIVNLTPQTAGAGANAVGAYAVADTGSLYIYFNVAGVSGTAYGFYYQIIETS